MGSSLAGKTALMTGGAQRLGAATGRALAAEGASVVIHYNRSRAPAEQLAQELQKSDTSAWIVKADLEKPEEVGALIPRALDLSGQLDILVNNASIFSPDTLMEATFENVVQNLRVNAWAPLALSRSFARHAKRGAIVNFLDTRVADYDWKHFSYIVSKNVLELWTRMTALEFAPSIRVNAVAPGLILPPPGKDEAYLEAMTGQVIYVDGGRHLMEHASGQNPD
jgi:NAD(P)-dependent dehydrogenase (short-subunit alcohol dehydrogenase family)